MISTPGARLLKVLIGTAIMAMGLLFTALLWRSYQLAEETRRWTPVPALVINSEMISERATPHSPMSYRADIRYRYTLDGKTHTGTRVKRVDGPSSSPGKANDRLESYPLGKSITCFADPAKPDFAILEHATRAGLYSLWFPLLFVAGGAGIVVSALRRR
jgi:hypothetical protein